MSAWLNTDFHVIALVLSLLDKKVFSVSTSDWDKLKVVIAEPESSSICMMIYDTKINYQSDQSLCNPIRCNSTEFQRGICNFKNKFNHIFVTALSWNVLNRKFDHTVEKSTYSESFHSRIVFQIVVQLRSESPPLASDHFQLGDGREGDIGTIHDHSCYVCVRGEGYFA